MTATATFRRQHAELADLAAELARSLGPLAAGAVQTDDALHAVARLAGKLRVHAAMEDEALYPRLFGHPDPDVKALASRFRREFGGVYEAFFAFRDAWTREAIHARPDAFAADARSVVRALAQRVTHENDELYAAVDRLYPEE